eukprot:scaffold90231_cov54-Attheya_sp.AAC.1
MNEIFHMTFTSCVHPSGDGGVDIDCAGDRIFSGPAARHVWFWRRNVGRGGPYSAAVELEDLVESVELLVAGGGQSGGNLSFFSRLSLSQLLIFSQGFHFIWIWMGSFDAGSSCGSNAGRLSRNGWLVVDIMHLNWQQSTQIGT